MAGRAKENLPGGSRYGTSSYMLKSVFLNVVTVYIYTGWWFGTLFFPHNIC